jgi:abortive infection bacteriophage resistance protein
MRYDKPHLSLDEQLARMEERGLIIADRAVAKRELARTGYYRLSGYLYQWRSATYSPGVLSDGRGDEFVGLHSLEEAIALYSFDRRLRILLLDAIERIEVAVRARVAHVHGRRGPLAYLDRTAMSSHGEKRIRQSALSNHERFLVRNQELLFRSSEVFAEHIRSHYDGYAPIWIAIECWDFGTLSSFFPLMPVDDQIEVASDFQLPNYAIMTNWLQAIGYLRNVCAHHQRLYRRTMTQQVGKRNSQRVKGLDHIESLPDIRSRKVYLHLCAIVHLINVAIPGSSWPKALKGLLLDFPVILGSRLSDYGFPDDWQDLPFWTEPSSRFS